MKCIICQTTGNESILKKPFDDGLSTCTMQCKNTLVIPCKHSEMIVSDSTLDTDSDDTIKEYENNCHHTFCVPCCQRIYDNEKMFCPMCNEDNSLFLQVFFKYSSNTAINYMREKILAGLQSLYLTKCVLNVLLKQHGKNKKLLDSKFKHLKPLISFMNNIEETSYDLQRYMLDTIDLSPSCFASQSKEIVHSIMHCVNKK